MILITQHCVILFIFHYHNALSRAALHTIIIMTAAPTTSHPIDAIDSDFIAHIESQIPSSEKWTDDDMYDFISDLDDIGITNEEEFENRFYLVMDNSWKLEAEFAEDYLDNVYNSNTDAMQFIYHAIDWQRVWDHSLCYDYDYIIHNGEAYFFNNH